MPYQVLGKRDGALALMIAWSRSLMARSGSGIAAIASSTAVSSSFFFVTFFSLAGVSCMQDSFRLQYDECCRIIKLLDIKAIVNEITVDSKKDLEKQVIMAARENGMSSVLFRNAIGRRLDLNITDSECLSLLSIKGISSPTELACYTGLTTGSTTAMLDRLEKAKFIKRMPNPKDRRGVLIEINQQYTETVGPFIAGLQQAQNELIASYSAKELETISGFLTRLTNNVKERTKAIRKDLI